MDHVRTRNGGRIMNWDEPPTEEFARFTNNPSIRYLRSVDHWFTLMKSVMNDLYFVNYNY